MITIFHIAYWEFITRFKTKSFLFSTFILPVVFSLLITLPIYFMTYEKEISTKLVGLVNFSGINITKDLQHYLNKNYILKNGSPQYIILPVSVENSIPYNTSLVELQDVVLKMDSITAAFNKIRAKRARYYRNPGLKNREYLLQKSYDNMRYENQKSLLKLNIRIIKPM
jgi:hypothetical protein